MRAIAGKLRVGLGAASLRAALAQAALPHSDLDGKRARTTQADLILVGGSIGGEQGAALATAVDDLVRQSHSDLRFAAMAAKRDPNETDPNNAIDVDMGDIMRLISLGFVGGKEAEIAEAELRALFKGAAAGPRAEGLRRVREILGLARKQRTEAIGVVNSAFQVRRKRAVMLRSSEVVPYPARELKARGNQASSHLIPDPCRFGRVTTRSCGRSTGEACGSLVSLNLIL